MMSFHPYSLDRWLASPTMCIYVNLPAALPEAIQLSKADELELSNPGTIFYTVGWNTRTAEV